MKFDAGALVSIADAESEAATEAAGQAEDAAMPGQRAAKPSVGGIPHKGQELGETKSEEQAAPAETAAAQASMPSPVVLAEAVVVPQVEAPVSKPEPAAEHAGAGTVAGAASVQASAAAAGMAALAVPATAQAAEPMASRDAVAEVGAGSARASGEGVRETSAQAGLALLDQAPAAKEGAEAPRAATGEIAVPQAEGTRGVPTDTLKVGQAETSRAVEGQQAGQVAIDGASLVQQVSAKLEPLRVLSPSETMPGQHAAGAGAQTAASQPTPLHVVPIEIGLKALSGMRQFDIRLDPAELGRVDVNLSISDDGSVSAKLVVDRVETLHLLQRDARTLERAFEQAGLKPSDGGVDISLRDQSDQSAFRQRQQEEGGRQSRAVPNEPAADEAVVTVDPAPVRRLVRLGGVDLSI